MAKIIFKPQDHQLQALLSRSPIHKISPLNSRFSPFNTQNDVNNVQWFCFPLFFVPLLYFLQHFITTASLPQFHNYLKSFLAIDPTFLFITIAYLGRLSFWPLRGQCAIKFRSTSPQIPHRILTHISISQHHPLYKFLDRPSSTLHCQIPSESTQPLQDSSKVSIRKNQITQYLPHIRVYWLSRIHAKYEDGHYGLMLHYFAFLKRSRAEGFLFSPLPAASALALFPPSFCRSNFVRMAT